MYRVATMYGLYGMSGPYMVLMYGSNPYIFGPNVRINSVHFRSQCTDHRFLIILLMKPSIYNNRIFLKEHIVVTHYLDMDLSFF